MAGERAVEKSDGMFGIERRNRIKALIAQSGRVNTGELAAVFGVSRDTIKRDLRALDQAGVLLKIYGGAAVVPSAGRPEKPACPCTLERVANFALRLIRPGQALFFDSSDESIAIAERLPTGLKLKIMTGSSRVLRALQYSRGCEFVAIGGLYDVLSDSTRGSAAIAMLSRMRADLFFVGGCKVDQNAGATTSNLEEAEIKREMARRSEQVVILSAGPAYGVATHVFATPGQISHVIAQEVPEAHALTDACLAMAATLQLV